MIKTILQKDDPALHKVCHPITKFDAKLAGLLGDMTDTLKQSGGLGLAAPQIGILRRVCVVLDEDETTYLELINPEILSQEGEQEGFEGCLSLAPSWSTSGRASPPGASATRSSIWTATCTTSTPTGSSPRTKWIRSCLSLQRAKRAEP